jgi:hypothetical protein
LIFKVTDEASPKATPPEGRCNVNPGQLGDAVGKKRDSPAAHRSFVGHRDDEKPIGKDEIAARVLSKRQFDFGSRSGATPVSTDDLFPV